MANPQPTDAHLRIAHSLLEQIMVSGFSKRQLSILLFILRLSWGCGKKEANIPRQSDFEIVGVGSGHIKMDLDWLMEAKVIYRNGNFYGFIKDYDQWRVSRAKGYRQEKVTEMVRLNLRRKSIGELKPDLYPYSGYFYIAESDTGIYKIGVSQNPIDRMELFRGLPFNVILLWSQFVKDAIKLEAQIKREYAGRHIKGEWYNFTNDELKEIKESAEDALLNLNYQNGNLELPKGESQVTERGTSSSRSGNFPTSKIATPKEKLNKYIKKGNYSSITNRKAMLVGLAYREKKVELGRELTTEEKVQIDIEVDQKMEQEAA